MGSIAFIFLYSFSLIRSYVHTCRLKHATLRGLAAWQIHNSHTDIVLTCILYSTYYSIESRRMDVRRSLGLTSRVTPRHVVGNKCSLIAKYPPPSLYLHRSLPILPNTYVLLSQTTHPSAAFRAQPRRCLAPPAPRARVERNAHTSLAGLAQFHRAMWQP